MKLIRRLFVLLMIAVITMLVAIACDSGGAGGAIRVGSKEFPEQLILGEMYALVLEDNGFEVERKLNLGGTAVAHESLRTNEIDLYPEYTGTGLLLILDLPSSSDPQAVYETVSTEYAEQFDLVWLEPAPMNNTYALLMTQEGAEQYRIQTISEMVTQASELTMVGTYEFQEREDGLPGLQRVYGNFDLKNYQAVIQPALIYQALIEGQADVATGFATDGEISAYDLVVLEDDKNLFPPYQVAPVVRQEILEENPGVREALNQIAPRITDEVMRRLNYEVTGRQREPAEVAEEFLTQEELLKSA